MNANSLWAGYDYAWAPNGKGRGRGFISGCRRVKLVRVIRRTETGNSKASSYAEVKRLNPDGTVIVLNYAPNIELETLEIRTRDIVDLWGAWSAEDADRQAAERIRQAEAQRAAEERRTAQEARRLLRQRQDNEIRVQLEDQGININNAQVGRVYVNSGDGVYINREEVLKWLNISTPSESSLLTQ